MRDGNYAYLMVSTEHASVGLHLHMFRYREGTVVDSEIIDLDSDSRMLRIDSGISARIGHELRQRGSEYSLLTPIARLDEEMYKVIKLAAREGRLERSLTK